MKTNRKCGKASRLAILAGSIALGFAMLSTSAHALVLDTKLGSAELGNSSDALEKSTLAGLLGVASDTLNLSKVENGFTVLADGLDQYYIDIAPDVTDYFILKFGGGSFPANTHDTYFFRNIDDLTKLVWNNTQVNGLQTAVGSDTRLSHYSLVNGDDGGTPPFDVPEPGALALLGVGLLGLGLARRRKSA